MVPCFDDSITWGQWDERQQLDLTHLLLVLQSLHYQVSYIVLYLTHTNVWESMRKLCSCLQCINPYFLLQFMREFVSGTISHVDCIWMCNKIEGSYGKIIITIVPSYTGKMWLVSCCWLITKNHDGIGVRHRIGWNLCSNRLVARFSPAA